MNIPAWLALPALVPAVATVLNVFFWWRSPDDWAAFVERAPRLALLVRLSRAWGVDWRKTLRLTREATRAFRAKGFPLPEAEDPPPAPLPSAVLPTPDAGTPAPSETGAP